MLEDKFSDTPEKEIFLILNLLYITLLSYIFINEAHKIHEDSYEGTQNSF